MREDRGLENLKAGGRSHDGGVLSVARDPSGRPPGWRGMVPLLYPLYVVPGLRRILLYATLNSFTLLYGHEYDTVSSPARLKQGLVSAMCIKSPTRSGPSLDCVPG